MQNGFITKALLYVFRLDHCVQLKVPAGHPQFAYNSNAAKAKSAINIKIQLTTTDVVLDRPISKAPPVT
jgi:hypothetical protein